MVTDDRSCIDVLTQISAAGRAPAGGRPRPPRRARTRLRHRRRPHRPRPGRGEVRRTQRHPAPRPASVRVAEPAGTGSVVAACPAACIAQHRPGHGG
ncbi:hypothetical protein [Streptomyces sp. NPDC059515]|uniref:hypothetical protein n=1 Tax=Streptomyces sp. NPDC059515 TaxID=3346854 RepID=UPI0036B8405B